MIHHDSQWFLRLVSKWSDVKLAQHVSNALFIDKINPFYLILPSGLHGLYNEWINGTCYNVLSWSPDNLALTISYDIIQLYLSIGSKWSSNGTVPYFVVFSLWNYIKACRSHKTHGNSMESPPFWPILAPGHPTFFIAPGHRVTSCHMAVPT